MSDSTIVAEVRKKARLIHRHLNHYQLSFQKKDSFRNLFEGYPDMDSDEFRVESLSLKDGRQYCFGSLELDLLDLEHFIQSRIESLNDRTYDATRYQIKLIFERLNKVVKEIEAPLIKLTPDRKERELFLLHFYTNYVDQLSDLVLGQLPGPQESNIEEELRIQLTATRHHIGLLDHLGILDALIEKIRINEFEQPNYSLLARIIKAIFPSEYEDISARDSISKQLTLCKTQPEEFYTDRASEKIEAEIKKLLAL